MSWPWLAGAIVPVAVVAACMMAPVPWIEKLRVIGSAISPQRPAHALYIGGMQLPLEARMLGIQLGFLCTVLTLILLGRGRRMVLPPWPLLVVLLGFVVLMCVDGMNATLFDNGLPYAYVPYNRLRLATGLLNGLAVGLIVLPGLNSLFWRERDDRPVVDTWAHLTVLVVVPAIVGMAVLWSAPALFYSVAILAICGELLMLSAINGLLCLTVMKHYRAAATTIWDVVPLAGVVVLLDALELAAMIAGKSILV